MSSLESAHRGYEYQDLMVACRLVDVLLGSITMAQVDKKLVPGDRFDDLTTVDQSGLRERVQVKHTDHAGQPLAVSTFASETRQLRLDELIRVALDDKDGPGADANDHCFRVILMEAAPTDPRLVAVLGSPDSDPGPFVRGMQSLRMKFRADALWSYYDGAIDERSGRDAPFSFLASATPRVNRREIEWFSEHLVVELNAPVASLDLTAPATAERVLLQRVRDEIGAGAYPNQDRAPLDVAAALIDSARAARRGSVAAEPARLLQRTGLRTDYGAVARRHPVNKAVEVSRSEGVAGLMTEVAEAACQQKPLLLVGPPGQGKSWFCKQVVDALHDEGWLVAEHYCYLGDADSERRPRVLAESILGSLLGRIAEEDHDVVAERRPRFAASHRAVELAVSEALKRLPQRRVALVVDGVDHVTRVVGGSTAHDPSFALVQELALLDLPVGSTLILLSQPGVHLQPLEQKGAVRLSLPGLKEEELDQLAVHLGVIGDGHSESDAEKFVRTLARKSEGNALYATYLCREALRLPSMAADPSAAIGTLPPFDGTLQRYYEHIQESLGPEAGWVSDILGVVDFPVTRAELKEIRPDAAHRVDDAVEVLRPVLSEHAGQSGIRIYHESYARFLQEPYREDATAKVALLERVIRWLDGLGIFDDTRAYRHLLRTLSLAGHHGRVVETVDRRFVIGSIARGFPASAVVDNLVVAVSSAARTSNWPAIVRYVEMSRSAETYQAERFESAIVGYADVVGELLGASTVADRLLHDGRPSMVARHGIQMCAQVDAMSAVAPWAEYMVALARESEDDNTIYGDASDRSVALARMRGRLRLASLAQDPQRQDERPDSSGDQVGGLPFDAPIDWDGFAEWIAESDLDERSVVDAVLDTLGYSGVVELTSRLGEPGAFYLAVAEAMRAGGVVAADGDYSHWVSKAVQSGVPAGDADRLIALGCDAAELARDGTADARVRLRELTLAVQERLGHHEAERVAEWIDACTVAARLDGIFLTVVEALIEGPGWYTCWLRFVVSLSVAETKPVEERSTASLRAIGMLAEVDNPFLGDPRACDLYSIHGLIGQTIWRAVGLLSNDQWKDALDVLDRVSSAMSTTIHGELGGPLARDDLLDLVVGTANAARHAVAEAFVENEIENGGFGRFYEDLARYRLAAARLALRSGDQDQARRRWTQACELLTGYGWRKDITIQELLQPLGTMISIAPERGRSAVAKLQGLCERIPQHTDGKSTWHTPHEWRGLLAAADPCALAEITARSLFESCNDPNSGLHEARSDLWRAWHDRADPVLSGALRLTLEEPLDDNDSASFARLANETPREVSEQMLVALLARIDERPFRYGYSNSDELLEKDNRRVEELNAVAEAAGLPMIAPSVSRGSPPAAGFASGGSGPVDAPRQAEAVVAGFPPGMPGVALAVRAWRDRAFDDTSTASSTDRFANILGYRIVGMAEDGSRDDAETALRLLADAVRFGDRDGLLKGIAEGLERHGERALAAIAYTLAWTRTRGRGGWMTFGGETEIDSLRIAAGIDRALVRETLAGEVERVIAHSLGSIGVTQALTLAFAHGCLSSDSADCFAIWDEAFAVISARTPRVAAFDDPDDIYTAPDPDVGEAVPGDIDAAFATATLAGVTHPGREQKRRSFLAAWTLVNHRATKMAQGIDVALRSASDPATLTWLLRLIAVAGDSASDIVRSSREALVDLAESPWLTVRVLARSLLPNEKVALGAPCEPDGELLGRGSDRIILPTEAADENGKDSGSADLVFLQASARLSRAERTLPGIIDAVIGRFRDARRSDALRERLRTQLRALETRPEHHWPDAFVVWSESIEDAIQRVASGARMARLMSGDLATDPHDLEGQLAEALLDDPVVPMDLEKARVPRPDIPAPPSRTNSLWSSLSPSAECGGSRENNDHDTVQVCGTVEMSGDEAVPLLTSGPYVGWRLVATVEQRTIPEDGYKANPKHDFAMRYRSIELRTDGDQRGLSSSPLAKGDAALWYAVPETDTTDHRAVAASTIIGLDSALEFATDGRYGLGLQPHVLTPARRLMDLLDLIPGRGFALEDGQGLALRLLTWRTEYETSEYHLPRPRLLGTGLALRGDLFDRLAGLAGGRLVFRDFLEGSAGLGD